MKKIDRVAASNYRNESLMGWQIRKKQDDESWISAKKLVTIKEDLV